jgi:hypothetical protein
MNLLILRNLQLVYILYLSHTCYKSCPFNSVLLYRPKSYCFAYKSWNVIKKKESLTLLTNQDKKRDSQITNNAE